MAYVVLHCAKPEGVATERSAAQEYALAHLAKDVRMPLSSLPDVFTWNPLGKLMRKVSNLDGWHWQWTGYEVVPCGDVD